MSLQHSTCFAQKSKALNADCIMQSNLGFSRKLSNLKLLSKHWSLSDRLFHLIEFAIYSVYEVPITNQIKMK